MTEVSTEKKFFEKRPKPFRVKAPNSKKIQEIFEKAYFNYLAAVDDKPDAEPRKDFIQWANQKKDKDLDRFKKLAWAYAKFTPQMPSQKIIDKFNALPQNKNGGGKPKKIIVIKKKKTIEGES